MNWVALVCRWAVGLLFIVAGLLKVVDPGAFLRDVAGYRLVDGKVLVAVAFFLPFFEIVTGAALALGRLYRGAAFSAGAMAAAFLVALVQAWIRGLDINCGCFGDGVGMANYPWWVARDVVVLGGCAVCWVDALRSARRGKGVMA